MKKNETKNETDFITELVFAIQNYRFIKVNAFLESVTIQMLDYQPVGDSVFSVNGNQKECNFKEYAKKIYKQNFNEIVY